MIPRSAFFALSAVLVALLLAAPSQGLAAAAAATPPAGKTSGRPAPTFANVRYGDHERHVLDFWQAKSVRPTPVLFFIHGGGWVGADKSIVAGVPAYLAAGISVVSINYRFIQHALAAGVTPPVQWPLHDAARALQFVRSKAKEWNIDKERIGASGGSAGACSSLWLAFHSDMADPQSRDPIARESTRLWCAAVNGAQTTLDPKQMFEWTPNSRYGGHAFGFWPEGKLPGSGTSRRDAYFAEFLAARERILPWIMEYSPMAHVTADDPPVYLHYSKEPPAIGQAQKDPTHSPNFGVKLREKLREVGVECELVYPGATEGKFPSAQEYLIDRLLRPSRSS